MRLIKPYYEIESEIDGEKILRHIEKAARTCYKTEGKSGDFEKTKKFVKMLVYNGHHSTLEHCSFSVRFIVDRGFTHELVRHRLVAFSQESTRYCNYSDEKFGGDVTYIIPPWLDLKEGKYVNICDLVNSPDYWVVNGNPIDTNDETYEWLKSLYFSEHFYLRLIDRNWSPQQARSVLPNSLKTEIVTTCNVREWRHIFKMRAEGVAGKPHPQMTEIMIPLLKEIQEKIPVLFDDIMVEK